MVNYIHTRIVLSLDPDARNGPWCAPFLLSAPAASFMADAADSGAQAIHSTVFSCSRNSAYKNKFKGEQKNGQSSSYFLHTLHSLELVCQIRTEWSFEQVAIRDPSTFTRTIRTHSRWPVNVFTQYPVATSHILMVLSRDADNR